MIYVISASLKNLQHRWLFRSASKQYLVVSIPVILSMNIASVSLNLNNNRLEISLLATPRSLSVPPDQLFRHKTVIN